MKEFLKPKKSKIILFFILLLIAFLTGFFSTAFGKMCGLGVECQQPFIHDASIFVFSILTFILNWIGHLSYFILIIGIILNLIYLYILSCLIIYIYNKIKKK